MVAYENGMASTYADGSFIGTDDINPVADSSLSLRLGEQASGGAIGTEQVDDLRLYDRPLTQAEVNTIYGGGNGDFVSVRTGNSVSIKKGRLRYSNCPCTCNGVHECGCLSCSEYNCFQGTTDHHR